MFKQLLRNLGKDDYFEEAKEIHKILKDQLQGNKGLIRKVKDKTDQKRKKELKDLLDNFCIPTKEDLSDLDEELNSFCNEMASINDNAYKHITYGFLEIMTEVSNFRDEFPDLFSSYELLLDEKNNLINVRWRLLSIMNSIVHQSLGQGNKAMAGSAGENLVRACLGCIGLKEGNDYRAQWKGATGSDTDFVIPYVENNQMSRIEIFIAAQFSSNDRARMASSELHSGGERYLITGNGMDASPKGLKDIGLDIIRDYERDNTKIVCRKSHMDEVIRELQNTVGSEDDRQKKIKFFEDYHLSLVEFTSRMKSRYR